MYSLALSYPTNPLSALLQESLIAPTLLRIRNTALVGTVENGVRESQIGEAYKW